MQSWDVMVRLLSKSVVPMCLTQSWNSSNESRSTRGSVRPGLSETKQGDTNVVLTAEIIHIFIS